MMSDKRTLLLSGAPGTGKTTMRRLAPAYFRERHGETAAFDTDEFYTFLDPDWLTNDRQRWQLAYDACLATAQWLLQQGVTTVLISSNGLHTSDAVNRALAKLYPYSAVYHVTLDARLDIVVERVRQRGDLAEHPAPWLAEWQQYIRGYYAAWTTIVDTSDMTAQQVLDQIYAICQEEAKALPALVP